MKIVLGFDGICGNISIPRGDYMVALQAENQQIKLVGGGKDYNIPATKRRSASRSRVTTISFYSGGGRSWSLVVTTPKNGEWISQIELDPGSSRK